MLSKAIHVIWTEIEEYNIVSLFLLVLNRIDDETQLILPNSRR